MKLTLAFDIFNKDYWLDHILESWLSNLSGKYSYEVIIVFDDSRDNSPEVARQVLRRYDHISYKSIYADDEYELYCNHLASEAATGEMIVFIQDDNWIFDRDWDDTLFTSVARVEAKFGHNVGMIGLLAGADFTSATYWDRVSINRQHTNCMYHPRHKYDLGVWRVDTVCRPFAIRAKTLRKIGGFDFDYRPTMFDDIDISLRLFAAGFWNIYIPFDVVNLVASVKTMGKARIRDIWNRNFAMCQSKNERSIRQVIQHKPRMLFPLQNKLGGLYFV